MFLRPGPHEGDLDGDAVLVGVAGRLAGARLPDPVRVLQPAGRRRRADREGARRAGSSARRRRWCSTASATTAAGRPRPTSTRSTGTTGWAPSEGCRCPHRASTSTRCSPGARTSSTRLDVRRDDLQHHAPGCYSAHSGIKAWQRRAQHAVLDRRAVGRRVARPRRASPTRGRSSSAPGSRCCSTSSTTCCPARRSRPPTTTPATSSARRSRSRSGSSPGRTTSSPGRSTSRSRRHAAGARLQPASRGRCATDVEIHYGVQPTGVHVVDDDGARRRRSRRQSTATTDDRSRGAVVFRADLPAFGYRLYRLRRRRRRRQPRRRPGRCSVDASRARERARPGRDRPGDRLDLAPTSTRRPASTCWPGADAGTHTQVCADPTDTWGHRVVSYAWPGEAMRARPDHRPRDRPAARPGCGSSGAGAPPRSSRSSCSTHDAASLRVDVTLDWREQAHLLKLRFPIALDRPAATYEIPFGHPRAPGRRRRGAGPVLGRPDRHGRRPTGRAHRDHHRQARLRRLARRRGRASASPPCAAPSTPGTTRGCSTRTTSTRYQDQGVQRFSYELVPHAGDWRAARPADGRPSSAAGPGHARVVPRRARSRPAAASPTTAAAVHGHRDQGQRGPGGARRRRRPDRARRRDAGRSGPCRIELRWSTGCSRRSSEPHQVRTFRVPRSGPIEELDLLELPVEA